MAWFNFKKEQITKGMPEDINRYLKREIEKCKTNLPGINYKFAHHLLIKYESIMDIWLASESSTSEIEGLKRDHAFCLKAVEDEKNLLWICQDCKKIISVFKNTIQGVAEEDFSKYLIGMIDTCPSCGGSRNALMKSGFLLSGLTLEQALHQPPLEIEKEMERRNDANQLLWMTIRRIYPDLKECNKKMVAIYGGINPIINMIREGEIVGLQQKDDDGNYWDVFGKLTPEDMKKFGLAKEQKAAEQKTADQGDADALYILGVKFANGRGVPQSDTEAIKWFQKAAEKKHVEAQYILGLMYATGRGVPESDTEAVKWYRLAANQGYANAQYNLGWMYDTGRGVPESDTEAAKWYHLAGNQGHEEAQYNLGLMYANGEGVPRSDSEAVKWYRLAADQGYANAQNNLGWMYANGMGVPRSNSEAAKWYRLAADQGHLKAKNNLKSVM